MNEPEDQINSLALLTTFVMAVVESLPPEERHRIRRRAEELLAANGQHKAMPHVAYITGNYYGPTAEA